MTSVRVAIVENDKRWIKLISDALRTEKPFVVVAMYTDAKAAIDGIREEKPHLALIDLELGGSLTGVDVIRKVWASTDCVVLSNFSDEVHLFESLRAGALGYLLKGDIEQMPDKLREFCFEGGSPMSSSIAGKLLSELREPNKLPGLTVSEMRILSLLARGYDSQDIALERSISKGTVACHIRNIYRKLRVHSQQAAITVFKNALCPGDITNPRAFIKRLCESSNMDDPVAFYVFERFDSDTKNTLLQANVSGVYSSEAQDLLLEGLNLVVAGPLIYREKSFTSVALRTQTSELIKSHPAQEELIRLNRFLLEDAFSEIVRKRPW